MNDQHWFLKPLGPIPRSSVRWSPRSGHGSGLYSRPPAVGCGCVFLKPLGPSRSIRMALPCLKSKDFSSGTLTERGTSTLLALLAASALFISLPRASRQDGEVRREERGVGEAISEAGGERQIHPRLPHERAAEREAGPLRGLGGRPAMPFLRQRPKHGIPRRLVGARRSWLPRRRIRPSWRQREPVRS